MTLEEIIAMSGGGGMPTAQQGVSDWQRAAMAMSMLGSALSNAGNPNVVGAQRGVGGAFRALGGGVQAAQRQGFQNAVQGMQVQDWMQERQRRNETQAMLDSMPAPEGFDEKEWRVFSRANPAEAWKYYAQSKAAARELAATERLRNSEGGVPWGTATASGGGTPAPGAGVAPQPSGGVFDVPTQFMPQVTAASQKYGVPRELLASTFWNESRWNPAAINKGDQPDGSASVGIGQWGEQWAKARGFDPRDPNASIDQTAKAMAEYAGKYGGNWMLARLAYGWGPGNVDMWLKSGADPSKIPEGAKTWLPRSAYGIADDREARAAWDKVAPMMRPGPVQMPWQAATGAQPGTQPSAAGQVAQAGGPPVMPQTGPGAIAAPPTQAQAPAAPQQAQMVPGLPGIMSDNPYLPQIQSATMAWRGARTQKDLADARKEVDRAMTEARKWQTMSPPERQKFEAEQQYRQQTMPTETIFGPDGKPRIVQRPQAVGAEPYVKEIDPRVQTAAIAQQAAQGENAAKLQQQGTVVSTVFKDFIENQRPKAMGALQDIGAIHTARQALDQAGGIISGPGADFRVFGGRVMEALGLPSDKAVNTDVFGAAVSQRVLALVKQLGAGSGISNADREYAAQAAGANYKFNESAIRRLLDIGERAAREQINEYQKYAGKWRDAPAAAGLPPGYLDVEKPPSYEDWNKANPLAPLTGGARGTAGPRTDAVQPPRQGRYIPGRGVVFD